jgi:hypothetical protein
MRGKILLSLFLCLFACLDRAFALGGPQYIETVSSGNSFPIVQINSAPAGLLVDTNDFSGVRIAANNLRTDISRVTGVLPAAINSENPGANQIIIGTLGKSEMIDRLMREKKIDVSAIKDKWESFLIQVVPKPFPGVEKALVICGSDKRGTIYGIYDLSENIGVSPWYFWTDVPPKHSDELYVKPGKFVQGPPAVKYRGIFINDEAPDLTGWAKEKFGGYNHAFYTNVFELLLRMKANYLWPAMWDNCFGEDDPLNAKLADEYGIVMGTSHVEPMARADKEWNRAGYSAREWNFQTHSNLLESFWREGVERNKDYEKIITIAMRGKIDTAMSPSANVALLEGIVDAQRKIISDVMQTNVADVPQLWALYKEVQEYYEKGMRVPDDVTLLWCDDNWGNIRRLPSPADRGRSGGAGVYYHLDYVGGPRNYKWINSVQNEKTWEQMELAYHYGADTIWVVNVGHLQHVSYPMEFFLTLAWDPDKWTKENISTYPELWAEREFDPGFTTNIADVVSKYTQYSARRKPELLSPNTYSLVNYQEADRVLASWKSLAAEANNIYQNLPPDERNAFFETVLYPVQASEILNELYIDAAKNHLLAAQGRVSASDYAAAAKALFQADAHWSDFYNHTLAGGKWDHMMDQTHIGYTGWQQPPSNAMPALMEIQPPDKAEMGVAIEGSTNVWPGTPDEAVLPTFDIFNQPARYLDVFDKGKEPLQFKAKASAPWITISDTVPVEGPNADAIRDSELSDRIAKGKRLWITLDWEKLPKNPTNASIKISSGTNTVLVGVNVFKPRKPSPNSVNGFVEADGYVSIEAEHFTKNVRAHSASWEMISGLGRTLSAMSIFPVTAPSVTPPKNSPCLEYKMYLFDSGNVDVETILSPTLNFVSGRGLRFALSFDDQPPQTVTAVPANYSVGAGDGLHDWERAVSDSARVVKTQLSLPKPGEHTLKVWMVDPGVVLQKIVVNCGGEKPSYLGPPESFHR